MSATLSGGDTTEHWRRVGRLSREIKRSILGLQLHQVGALPFQPSSPHRPAPCETGHVSLFTAEQLVQPSGSVRRSRKGKDTGHVPLTNSPPPLLIFQEGVSCHSQPLRPTFIALQRSRDSSLQPSRFPSNCSPRSPAVSHRAKLRVWVRLILSAGSLGNVTSTSSRSRRKWVTGRWGTLTSATPAPRKAAAIAPSGPLSASLSCTACWDTGGLKYHLSPPSRMSCSCRVGGKKEKRWGRGRGRIQGQGFLACHLVSGFLLALSDLPLLSFLLPLEENVNSYRRQSLVALVRQWSLTYSPTHTHSHTHWGQKLINSTSETSY